MNQEQKINGFLSRVNKQSGIRLNNLETDCWEWTGTLGKNGYGQIQTAWADDRYAHRFSYILYKGKIDDKQLIRHKCDNRKCVNPDHLEIGTKEDNNKDARERNPKANGRKLQPDQYPIIVERMKTEKLKDIAEDYKMNWKSISRALDKAGLRPDYDYGKKTTDEMIETMKQLQTEGQSYQQIATQIGLSIGRVWTLLNN